MTQSASAPLLRLMNAQTVLETVRRLRPVTRAEVARVTGMAKPTVSNVLQDLLDVGLVREVEPADGRPRQRGNAFETIPEAAFVFGLDVGGLHLRGALVDLDGEVRAREGVLHTGLGSAELPHAVAELRDRLLDKAGVAAERLEAAVVGVPGVVNPDNGRVWRLNPERVESYQIVESLEASLGHPVRVENDVNLAAIGEQWRGLADDCDDFVFLSIGTGVGAGLVLRGELYRGRHGAAGEVDMPGDSESPAAHALLNFAQRHGLVVSSPEEIFTAARAGDAVAQAVVAEEARRIAEYLIPIARINDVELVVLGGGIGVHCQDVVDDIRRHLRERVHYPPRLEISALGDTSVLTGALAVGVRDCAARLVSSRLARVPVPGTDTSG
ncbi:ROK family transcriptional regulator [Streptomyces sp. NPDC058459]|uniref:ROK family transcriptional regulator n=1 Tax=Streptomyces sp. NPDC058459 TaxID=3346508 RepID=UPI003646FD75